MAERKRGIAQALHRSPDRCRVYPTRSDESSAGYGLCATKSPLWIRWDRGKSGPDGDDSLRKFRVL